jgi:hypothetical protein
MAKSTRLMPSSRYAKAKRVPLPPLISDAIFVRCAYLDLTGLLPSPEEQDAFARAIVLTNGPG